MATILDVPPEILDMISAQLLPHSIVPFVLTCKTIHSRCQPALKKHNAYRSRWTEVSHQGPHRNDLSHFLLQIARDPLVAGYIQRLHLWDKRSDGEIEAARLRAKENADPEKKQREWMYLEDMVLQCEILKETGLDSAQWWQDLEWEITRFELPDGHVPRFSHNREDSRLTTTLITLFMFLPELKELGLPTFWPGLDAEPLPEYELLAGSRKKVLTYLVQRARVISPRIPSSPLAKLESLLPYRTSGYEERLGFQEIEPFLPLPNLRNVYSVSSIATHEDTYTGVGFSWKPPNHLIDMPLRRLELWGCIVDGDGLRTILSRTPLLEVLRYKHEVKWHGCGYEFEAWPFLDAVIACVSSTLTQLAIVTIDSTAIEEPVSDFKDLHRLETLECDFNDLLQGEAVALVEILPTSIKRVICHVNAHDIGNYNFDSYLSGMKARKDNGFSALEALEFLVWTESYEDMMGMGSDYYTKGLGSQAREIIEAHGASFFEQQSSSKDGIGWDAEFCRKFSPSEDDYDADGGLVSRERIAAA